MWLLSPLRNPSPATPAQHRKGGQRWVRSSASPLPSAHTATDGTFLFPRKRYKVFSVLVLKRLLLQVQQQAFSVERARGRFSGLVLLPKSRWKQGVLCKTGTHGKDMRPLPTVFQISFRCCFVNETILCMSLHTMVFGESSNTHYLNVITATSISSVLLECTAYSYFN